MRWMAGWYAAVKIFEECLPLCVCVGGGDGRGKVSLQKPARAPPPSGACNSKHGKVLSSSSF